MYYKSVKKREELIKTNFVKIVALSQYGHVHEISLYAAIKGEFKEVKYYQEVIDNYPIIGVLSQQYKLSPRTVILAAITSIIYEPRDTKYQF